MFVYQDGFAPIHIAAALGHMEFMKYLLAHPEVEHNKQNDKGNTAFMLAVEHNRREVVELLLDSPFIDVNMHNKKVGVLVFFVLCSLYRCDGHLLIC